MGPKQANILVLRRFLLIAILLASLAATSSPASAQAYLPGVHVGDWLLYTDVYYNVRPGLDLLLPPGMRSLIGTTSIRTEVTGVVDTNVTVSQQRFNQTSVRNVTLQGDVKTGLGNLTYWIIAGGLSQNDPISEAWRSPSINTTLVRLYAGASRYVNLLTSNQTLSNSPVTVQALGYWDQASGALLEFSIQVYGTLVGLPVSASAHVKVTETNIWQAQPDFTITTNPSSLTVQEGASSFSNITLTSVGGYSNTVFVTSTVSTLGFQVKPSTKQVSVGPGSPRYFLLSINTTVSTPVGAYTIAISAVDNSNLSHDTSVAVMVTAPLPQPDFELVVSVKELAVEVGSTGFTSFQIRTLHGFTGSITLSAISVPSGPVLALPPGIGFVAAAAHLQVTVPATLQVTVPHSTSPGSYVLTIAATGVSATGDERFHTASLLLNATAPSPSQGTSQTPVAFSGVTLPLLVGIVAVAVLLVSAIAYIALRRARPRPKSQPESSPVP